MYPNAYTSISRYPTRRSVFNVITELLGVQFPQMECDYELHRIGQLIKSFNLNAPSLYHTSQDRFPVFWESVFCISANPGRTKEAGAASAVLLLLPTPELEAYGLYLCSAL